MIPNDTILGTWIIELSMTISKTSAVYDLCSSRSEVGNRIYF